ncbi:restriction endonuclease fold toxin 5 domain-containing protein [Burkholderia pseudomallei]|uniref:restriction endonuclease fold toxin 5 domain-containing protein n=1 Tax=Burkholderia pseudomallei TaxID=28450 RepID=UPI001FB9FE52|nr:restriction endonuclease fold toxin 5 domain-containing protein [Burkholderia pseudomallei]
MVFPVIEAAAVELGPILARVGVALLGGATVAGTASLSGDTPKEDSKATPDVRALPRTGESCKKCPPEAGTRVRRNHGVNWNSYRYQARITGFPFDTEACRWSEEWRWLGVDFDGFQPGECLLQETKGNYDQFLDVRLSTVIEHGNQYDVPGRVRRQARRRLDALLAEGYYATAGSRGTSADSRTRQR